MTLIMYLNKRLYSKDYGMSGAPYRFSTVVFQSDLDAHLFPFAVPVEQFVVGFRVAYGSSVRIGEPHDCLSGSIGYVGSYAV